MNEQALRQLVMDADAAVTTPGTSSDLAVRVQKRLRRRRQMQMGGASVLLCALLAIVPMMRTNSKPSPLAGSSQTKRELALIRVEADSQAATVNRMVQFQKSLDVRVAV